MRIFVIENRRQELADTLSVLREAFPEAEIWPADASSAMVDWDAAFEMISGLPAGDRLVLLMDLALRAQTDDAAAEGRTQAQHVRSCSKEWILIAHTSFGFPASVVNPETFDGVISKYDVQKVADDRAKKVAYYRNEIGATIRRRFPQEGATRAVSFRRADSLGMRMLERVLGEEGLSDLVERLTAGWSGVSIEVLSSGYSGAFPLRLRGRVAGADAVLIAKVARDRAALGDEAAALTRWRMQLGPLAGIVLASDGGVAELPKGAGWYLVQPEGTGPTLLGRIWESGSLEAIEPVVGLLGRVLGHWRTGALRQPINSMLRLNGVDIARIETSLRALEEVGRSFAARGDWAADWDPVEKIAEAVRLRALNWRDSGWGGIKVPVGVQHGDLNPGNVLVADGGTPILIDVARLGMWPIGYDYVRLALMLRLRLEGVRDGAVHYPSSVKGWVNRRMWADLDGRSADGGDLGVGAASKCLRALGSALGEGGEWGERAWFGALAGMYWDLLKVLSYTDVPVTKRVWALLELAELGAVLDRRAERLAG